MWRDADVEIPAEQDMIHLVKVTGKYRNIGFQGAVMTAEYSQKEGWIVELFPEWENPGVSQWMPIPTGEMFLSRDAAKEAVGKWLREPAED